MNLRLQNNERSKFNNDDPSSNRALSVQAYRQFNSSREPSLSLSLPYPAVARAFLSFARNLQSNPRSGPLDADSPYLRGGQLAPFTEPSKW